MSSQTSLVAPLHVAGLALVAARTTWSVIRD